MLSQKEAVYKATKEVLASKTISFQDGNNVRSVMSDTVKDAIVSKLVVMFTANEVELKASDSNADKLSNPTKLRTYVVGLVSNWFNKDTRLNGGVKQAKTEKSTTPKVKTQKVNDEKTNNLLSLKKILESQGKDTTEVVAELDKRKKEIELEKAAKDKKIDLSSIPDEFKDLLS